MRGWMRRQVALVWASRGARWRGRRTRGWRWWPTTDAVNSLPALDGLRAVAVLLVLIFHAWNDLPGYIQPGQNPYDYLLNYGRTGVHLFFVLSGFLLFLPYARWLLGMQGPPSTLAFYRRRLLRVGPAYWICLSSMAGLALLAGPLTLLVVGGTVADGLLHAVFLSNAFAGTTFAFNGVFWTMAVEVQYYALLPLIGWGMVRIGQRRPMRAAALIVGVLVLISLGSDYVAKSARFARLTRVPLLSGLLLGEYSLPFWLGIFGAGIACSVVYVAVTMPARTQEAPPDRSWQRPATLRRWGNRALAGGLVLWAGLALLPGATRVPAKDLLFGAIYASILFGVLCGAPALTRVLRARPLRFVGLISYSCYLWHAPLINLVEAHLPASLSIPEKVLAGVLLGGPLALAAAYVSYQLTERPFLPARRRARALAEGASASLVPAVAPPGGRLPAPAVP